MHTDSQIISYYSKDVFPCHLVLTRSDKFISLCHLVLTRSDKFISLYLISTFCCFVVSVLVLLFVALCVFFFFLYEAFCFRSYLVFFVILCFSVLLALQLPRFWKRANLSVFRTFVQFVLVWICRFPLPLGVWEGLRFVTLALPGLFSYLFVFFTLQGDLF